MKSLAWVAVAVCSTSLFATGGSEKSTVKDQTKITTPGGTTTITTEKDVKKTGDHKTGEGSTTPTP